MVNIIDIILPSMKINKHFFNTIKPVLIELREKVGADFVVFGSTPLYLLGVVEFNKKINDIDIALKDVNNIPTGAQVATFHGNPKQQFHKINIKGISIDIGCEWEGWPNQKSFFQKIFTNPIEVEGFKFANLDVIEEWKRDLVKKYNREKDREYLHKISEYRLKQKDEQ